MPGNRTDIKTNIINAVEGEQNDSKTLVSIADMLGVVCFV